MERYRVCSFAAAKREAEELVVSVDSNIEFELVKSYLRSTVSQERLNGLAQIAVGREIALPWI
jgi:hypothetical protein